MLRRAAAAPGGPLDNAEWFKQHSGNPDLNPHPHPHPHPNQNPNPNPKQEAAADAPMDDADDGEP